MIIYLHGFNSSPNSHKAHVLATRMAELGRADELCIPTLPHWPAQAIADVVAILESAHAPVSLIGSSLGGYYATWLAERFSLAAVLINPAVKPYRLLTDHLGPQQNPYTGEAYRLTSQHLEQLQAIDVAHISEPARYLALLQSDDEVLDYRQAQALYGAARCRVSEGGAHAFAGFESVVDDVLSFCDINQRTVLPARR